jgi:hypothetical protein
MRRKADEWSIEERQLFILQRPAQVCLETGVSTDTALIGGDMPGERIVSSPIRAN